MQTDQIFFFFFWQNNSPLCSSLFFLVKNKSVFRRISMEHTSYKICLPAWILTISTSWWLRHKVGTLPRIGLNVCISPAFVTYYGRRLLGRGLAFVTQTDILTRFVPFCLWVCLDIAMVASEASPLTLLDFL